MIINTGVIAEKINSYVKSTSGKKKIYEKLQSMDKENTDIAKSLAGLLGEYIAYTAEEYELPRSVINLVTQIEYSVGTVVKKKNERAVEIGMHFTGDLYRMSLSKEDGRTTGDGIDNIIALFNNGYTARKSVKGIWHGHEELGTINSVKHRDPTNFLQDAINDFINDYAGEYNITVSLSPKYK